MCIGYLENIVMNAKYDSEHEDDLGTVLWHKDKMGTLNALFFTLLISIFDEKILAVRLVFMFAFFFSGQLQDSHAIKRDLTNFNIT